MIDSGNSFINSMIGGSIMAVASSLHLYLEGKITGISGTIFKCISLKNFSYSFSFIIGMIFTSSLIKNFFIPNNSNSTFLENNLTFVEDLSIPGFILAGFLVGFGAKMANGCTSGHGICGLPRLSKRSFAAISLFMIFGIIMATLKYYIPFLKPKSVFKVFEGNLINYSTFALSLIGFVINSWNVYKNGIQGLFRDIIISFLIGVIFAYGLIESGMLQRHIVINFLTIGTIWNPQLMFVLGSAVGINFLTFNFILKKISKPKFKENYDLPTNKIVDNKLCIGSAIFGTGWGLSGICPGPAVLTCYLYFPQMAIFFIFLCIGIYLEYYFDSNIENLVNRRKNISSNINNKFQELKEEIA